MSRRRSRKAKYPFDTLVALLAYAGLAVATFTVEAESRQVILWCGLLVVDLAYTHALRVELSHPLGGLGRGAAAGLIVSLPVLILLQPNLTDMSGQLLPSQTGPALFMGMVLVAPFVEEMFFRELLQGQHGIVLASMGFGGYLVLFFLPGLIGLPVTGLVLALVGVLLGLIYGYVKERYGLTASMSCHAVVNLMVFFLPAVIPDVVNWLG